jgi:uncharacterized membrane protein YeaQ/YmgE (transglycosylase-associated protein family)
LTVAHILYQNISTSNLAVLCDVFLHGIAKFVSNRYPIRNSKFVEKNPMFGIIAWIILGVIAGAVAKLIVPGRQGGGFFATAALGIAGSFIGGAIHNLIKYHTLMSPTKGGQILSLGSIGVAVVGAIIAIFLWGLVMGRAEQ